MISFLIFPQLTSDLGDVTMIASACQPPGPGRSRRPDLTKAVECRTTNGDRTMPGET